MEDVVALWDFQQLLIVLEVAMTHATLLLKHHKSLLRWNRARIVLIVKVLIRDCLDRPHINTHYTVDVVRIFLFFVETSERSFFTLLPLLEKLEANKLDDNDGQEYEDR